MRFTSESSYLCAVVSIICAVETVVLLEARPQSVVSFMSPKNSTAAADDDDVHYQHSRTTTMATNPRGIQRANESTDSARDRIRILTHPSNHRKESIIEDINDQEIVFPDSFEVSLETMSRLNGPPSCAGDGTFCENIESYPYTHLRDVLRKTKARNDLFGLDETSDEIANRIGEPEEMFICGSIEKIIYPKVGKTKYNEWKYIINQGDDDGYIQGVRVEICKRVNRPCDLIGSLPDGYTTSCKQKYVYRRMLGISEMGQPVADTFLMPSACCCSYTRDIQYLSDFGRHATPVRTKR